MLVSDPPSTFSPSNLFLRGNRKRMWYRKWGEINMLVCCDTTIIINLLYKHHHILIKTQKFYVPFKKKWIFHAIENKKKSYISYAYIHNFMRKRWSYAYDIFYRIFFSKTKEKSFFIIIIIKKKKEIQKKHNTSYMEYRIG